MRALPVAFRLASQRVLAGHLLADTQPSQRCRSTRRAAWPQRQCRALCTSAEPPSGVQGAAGKQVPPKKRKAGQEEEAEVADAEAEAAADEKGAEKGVGSEDAGERAGEEAETGLVGGDDTGSGPEQLVQGQTGELTRSYPSPDELWDKYGVLSEMDDRHKHLTVQEFATLWWKLQEFARTGTTADIWDIHTTAQHRDNWELNYQLLVRRFPPHIQELYRETFNKPYLTFRPPKVKMLGMPPPQDYLDVWQAEQPTFYIKETLRPPWLFGHRQAMYVALKRLGLPLQPPRSGLCRLKLSHPNTNDIPDTDQAYACKLQPGQVAKLLPEDEMPPAPFARRRFLIFKRPAGINPDTLSLPWCEIVAKEGDGMVRVKVFEGSSRMHSEESGELVPSTAFETLSVPESRILLGVLSLDYIPLNLPLRSGEITDMIRLLWPAPLSDETVKFMYSQEGYEYPWEAGPQATYAHDFDVNALLLPYEFVSKREPDLPNTLGKITVVVDSREYPVMVDFWDALRRFDEARRNLVATAVQTAAVLAVLFVVFWSLFSLLKFATVSRTVKPYLYYHLKDHPRYKYIYNPQYNQVRGGAGPWAYEQK